MKVLLVAPTHHYKTGYPQFLSFSDFPSGFGYLAAVLNKLGHEVYGLNPNNITGYASAKVMLKDILSRKIQETQPDIIGLGGLCTDYEFLRDAVNISRATADIPLVLGGQIVTNDAEFICGDLHPDVAIAGEAEEAIAWLTQKHTTGKILESEPVKNLDLIPFPDYEPFGIKDMLDNHSMDTRLLYRYPRAYPRPFNIVASRSCPFACTFCIHSPRTAPYRARSISNIMEEIKTMYEKYEFNILIILDELFAVNKSRMNDFSQAVLEGKEKYHWDFDWMFQTHACAKFDEDSIALAKQAGCFFFSYGLESASPKVLESMNKKLVLSQVVEAMELAEKHGVGFGANLIFGDIAETEETWAESLSFWLKHCQKNFVFLSNVMPYPGSKLFADCQAKGMFQDKRRYYEHIDEGAINMTAIPNKIFAELLNVTMFLEKAWLFVNRASKTHYELETGNMYKIYATCFRCGSESTYREKINAITKPFMIGSGCQKCNQRMSIWLNT